ncbi:MAG: O-antigen ligase family protein [Petrimonas sp.]|uniref:hypothetical protein n=1 Tax=Petrimonas sp. TaxID=2023866 RepID=UPI002B37364F|nr:O-antigen ligase family protein [Petrimonas sp.]
MKGIIKFYQMVVRYIVKEKIIQLFSVVSYYLFCLSIIIGMDDKLTLLACIFIIPYAIIDLKYDPGNKVFFFLLFFLVIGSLLNLLFSKNGFGGTFVVVGVLFLAKYIIKSPKRMRFHILFFLLFYMLWISYKIFVLKLDPNEFYENMSRNYVGLILVMFTTLYSFISYAINYKTTLVIPILSTVLSFFLFGRSSIISMVLLLIVNFFYYLKMHKKKYISFFLILSVIILIAYSISDLSYLYSISPFQSYGWDTPRYNMWKDFFDKSTLLTFVVGIDTFSIPSVALQNGNVHNDFINLLARTGIGFVAFISVFILNIIISIKKKQFYLTLLLLILSIRMFYDTGIFISNLGFCFYAILLYPFFKNNINTKFYDSTSFNVNNAQKEIN